VEASIRVGLVGYGLAGAFFHAPLIRTTTRLKLAAIVTSNSGRAIEARRMHPEAVVFATASELWDFASNLDMIVVATPNRTHVPLASAALSAGLHVVVDKPFAPTAAEGRQLIEHARSCGRMVTVFHNRRWDGDFLTVRRILREGALGDPFRFESRFERWRPVPKPGWRERGGPEEAGGILYDLGSHLIDQALVLFGPVVEVFAELDRRRSSVEVDDDAFVALTHASGVRSHLSMSALSAQAGPRFRLLGNRAAYVKHGYDVQEAALRGGAQPDNSHWGEEPRAAWGLLGRDDDLQPVPTEQGAYQDFYESIVAAITSGGQPPVDPDDAVSGLEIIEAARKSAFERRVVTLPVHSASRVNDS